MTSPGPFCEALGLSSLDLVSENISINCHLKHGHIIELKQFADKSKLPVTRVVSWIHKLQPELKLIKEKTLLSKITRCLDTNKKLISKRKVAAFKNVKAFKESDFISESDLKKLSTTKSETTESVVRNLMNVMVDQVSKSELPKQNTDFENKPVSCNVYNKRVLQIQPEPPVQTQSELPVSKDSIKSLNVIQYEVKKKQKMLSKLQHLVTVERENFKRIKSAKGHYSVRNVTKRDVAASKTRRQLREANVTLRNQKTLIEKYEKRISERHDQSQSDICEKRHMKKILIDKESEIDSLHSENEKFRQRLGKVFSAKRSASYFRRKMKNLRTSHSSEVKKNLLKQLKEKDREIDNLKLSIEFLQGDKNDNFETRTCDGSFSEPLRLCVIQLAGLEVATEKIPRVIQVVCSQLFNKKLSLKDLPSATTTQTIVDEGHFLAKRFIADKIDCAANFGLNRDGTTRKKQKILDTSVTLDNGEVMSLGFTRVANETSKTINEVTKNHLQELSKLHVNGEEQFIRSSLAKLSFSMCDRASNEKAADRLLDEWKEEVLNQYPEVEKETIKHFHCMAHVLLGFHKYACDNFKSVEKITVEENGPLGRDTLALFKTWRTAGTIVERAVRTISESFGPAGDHHGVRDRWEAYCFENGVKSIIGNYRDNRFNGLFQTAAEVIVHADDMSRVLDTVKNPNKKLIAVKADISCQRIRAMIYCFSLFYVKLTGPYWNIVTSNVVPYLLLFTHIQDMKNFLEKCCADPKHLTDPNSHWSSASELKMTAVPHQERIEQAMANTAVNVAFVHECIKTVSTAMIKCIDKQLKDFLPGGQFSQAPSSADLQRTGFAHTTNLSCEHHFGDLDSSQRRRPNASMHHHSSVQLLKRNGNKMINWLSEMSVSERKTLLKDARKGGQDLRKLHMQSEKAVLKTVSENMLEEKNRTSGKKRKRNGSDNDTPVCEKLVELTLKVSDYVVVAYQDQWYPGHVEECLQDGTVSVNFLAPTKKPGHFIWPARTDRQRVAKEFILKTGFVPECVQSGRLWYLPDFKEINALYKKYSEHYFL